MDRQRSISFDSTQQVYLCSNQNGSLFSICSCSLQYFAQSGIHVRHKNHLLLLQTTSLSCRCALSKTFSAPVEWNTKPRPSYGSGSHIPTSLHPLSNWAKDSPANPSLNWGSRPAHGVSDLTYCSLSSGDCIPSQGLKPPSARVDSKRYSKS